MDDPEIFDYTSPDNSVDFIKMVQENYNYLIENNKLHETDPGNIQMIVGTNYYKDLARLFSSNE